MKRICSSFLPAFPTDKFMALTVVTAALTGCQVVGRHGNSMDSIVLPASWHQGVGFRHAAASVDLRRWWGEFNDPVLTELIRGARAQSPDLKSAVSVVREARARRISERSGLFPSLTGDFSAGAGRSKSEVSSGGFDTTVQNSTESYSAGLDASWEVDLFGKQRAAVAAAGADEYSAEETLSAVQASLASEVALAYLDLRTAEARLAVVRENVKNFEETYQLASWREEAGQIDALDAEQTKSNLEQLRSNVPPLEQAISSAKNSLALLSGKVPGALDGVLSSRSGRLPEPPRKLAVGIPADTLRQRPDVRGAGYDWLAAVYRTDAAEAARMPSLSLNGSLGVDALSSSKIFNPEQAAASVIAGLTAPIFDAGQIRSQIEIQSEQEEQALQAYKKTVLTALSEVEDALMACRKNEERAVITERALVAARTAEELARQRYEAGVVDITTVLTTQQALLSLEDQSVTVKADRSSSFVGLYKALGGGWQR
ncbi:efflux transporter outer membrane subunit [Luteolibacter sp. AS25]|uniref:efflux transporter outer membrane subunit n=1 Tax=Luteolibacter sp. AS25 TaxID=3135776 RepID=UPI00398BAB15